MRSHQLSLSRPHRFRITIRALLLSIAVIGLLVAGVLRLGAWLDPFDGRAFDSDVWHQFARNDEAANPRASMAGDVKRRYLRPGTARPEVRRLLGRPDFEERDHVLKYNLGMLAWHVDYWSLDIHFDSQGEISRVEVVQH